MKSTNAVVLITSVFMFSVWGWGITQAAGRLEGFDPKRDRYTLTEVRRAILEQIMFIV